MFLLPPLYLYLDIHRHRCYRYRYFTSDKLKTVSFFNPQIRAKVLQKETMAQSRSEAGGPILHYQIPFQTFPKCPYLQPQSNEDDTGAQSHLILS